MKYSQAVLFVVGSGVLGGVLGVPNLPTAAEPQVPTLGSATQLAHSNNSPETLATTAGRPDALNPLTTSQLATNSEAIRAKRLRRKMARKYRLASLRKSRVANHLPASESLVAQAPQDATEPAIPQLHSQFTAEKPIKYGEKHRNLPLPAPVVPTTRSFEDDNLFVRERDGHRHRQQMAAQDARDLDEDLYVREPGEGRSRGRRQRKQMAEQEARDFDEDLYVREPGEGRSRGRRQRKQMAEQEARDFDEDLYVRETLAGPESGAAQLPQNVEAATPEPALQPAKTRYRKKYRNHLASAEGSSEVEKPRRRRQKKQMPAPEAPTTRDFDEDLYARMVQTLADLEERDLLDLENELAARDFAYDMDLLD